jgi:hypothetical protein
MGRPKKKKLSEDELDGIDVDRESLDIEAGENDEVDPCSKCEGLGCEECDYRGTLRVSGRDSKEFPDSDEF